MDAVVVSNVSKTFHMPSGDIYALKDVDLQIKQGKIFGLLGPNGAGKTTLISILGGTTTADEGFVQIFGHDLNTHLHEAQQIINIVRGFSGVLRNCTVLQLMRYYALLYNVHHAEKRIEHILKRVGLWERRAEVVSSFSSGWRQLFFVAKALLNTPKLLLLDEPTVGLDVDVAYKMRKLIKELQKEGYTILLTTHYMQEAEELCDEIALIAKGKIVAQGTAQQLKEKVKEQEAVEIEGDLPKKVQQALVRLPGVLGHAKEHHHLRLFIKDEKVMQRVLRVLAKTSVTKVQLHEPTLEDVFVKLTKQKLEDKING